MTYAQTLDAWLNDNMSEVKFAQKVNCAQASISRYRHGQRLPKSSLAKRIDEATNGVASYALWREAAMAKAEIE